MHVTQRLLVEPIGADRNIIFNPLSGAVDLARDQEIARLTGLQNGVQIPLTAAEEFELRSRRYLFESAEDEERYLEGLVSEAWARMDTGQPEVYTVCPTLACNLACGYCFEGDSLHDKKQGVLTDRQVELLFEAIAAIRSNFNQDGHPPRYAPLIALFGGEPLLPSTRHAVAQILDRAFDCGFVVGATTNGVNIVRYEALLREYTDILAGFQITLDGPKAVHDSRRHRLGGQGTFDEIVAGIDLVVSLGVSVDLRVNLDFGNIDSLPELAEFVLSKGWGNSPGFRLALAGVTEHREGGCHDRRDDMLTELDLGQRVIALMDSDPALERIVHLGFMRHLDHLTHVLEPERYRAKGGHKSVGPRYWYCEASTEKQFVFTPEGLIYNCTEAVGNPRHAVGRFDPELDLWQRERGKWIGRHDLSHPKCRACSISTLCGGGCHMAAREREAASQGSLLQITIGKPKSYQSSSPAEIPGSVDPFCGMAEETVRAYLRYAGARIGK